MEKSNTRMMWLPEGENVLKICLFVLTESTNVKDELVTGQAPGYLAAHRRRQRSPTSITTCVTHRKSNIFGDRCFAVAGPRLWNSLPINLRQCHSLEQFKRLLRTFLFSAWSHGALWDLPKSVPYINLLTYLLTFTFIILTLWGLLEKHVFRYLSSDEA